MSEQVPYCHGEPMQPTYRYMKEGIIYQTFTCMKRGCHRTQEVILNA